MTKINITKPTGTSESLSLLSAFKVEENTYLVFDSEKISSTGLPIIYLSKLTTKLENITEETEWTSVKNYLKGIISGTNFLYIKPEENYPGDEVFYRALTLPASSFDLIKSRYEVKESAPSNIPTITTESASVEPNQPAPDNVVMPSVPPVNTPNNEINVAPPVEPAPSEIIPPTIMGSEIPTPEPLTNVAPTTPIIPKNEAESNITTSEVKPLSNVQDSITPEIKTHDFSSEKETFLKACENMFDALVSKYQKELNDIEVRKAELEKKEAEIATKLKDATEHLANAEAKEQVANIAHDNAKKIMDIGNLMPTNPESNPTGVI